MKPLVVLLSAFMIILLVLYAVDSRLNLLIAGNIAMSIMLLFTAIGHFIFTKGMALMLPDSLKYRNELVIITGIMEVIFALGLIMHETRILTSWAVIVFLVLIFPANVHAMSKNVNHEKATYDGDGYKYLWFRLPLQLFFIAWIAYFGIYLQNHI